MKIANVIPIFKSGIKNSFDNFGPISLLPQFFYILEKRFDKRIEYFFNKFNAMYLCMVLSQESLQIWSSLILLKKLLMH